LIDCVRRAQSHYRWLKRVYLPERWFAEARGAPDDLGFARVSQVQLLQPFVTFTLASFLNGETITQQIVLFAAAVAATVAISTRTRGQAAPAKPNLDREPPQLAA